MPFSMVPDMADESIQLFLTRVPIFSDGWIVGKRRCGPTKFPDPALSWHQLCFFSPIVIGGIFDHKNTSFVQQLFSLCLPEAEFSSGIAWFSFFYFESTSPSIGSLAIFIERLSSKSNGAMYLASACFCWLLANAFYRSSPYAVEGDISP